LIGWVVISGRVGIGMGEGGGGERGGNQDEAG